MMTLQQIQQPVQKGNYAFYKHALTGAEKDGVRPEDVVHVVR